jgi:hypothetical protein
VNGVDLSKLTIGLKGSADLLVELAYGAARRQRARDRLGDSSDVNVMEAAALTIQCDSCCIAGVGFWPISEVSARRVEVRTVRNSGLDLLTLSSSRFDPI